MALSTSQLRVVWASWYGETAKATKSARVTFPGDGRDWSLLVADRAVDAFRALASLMRHHGYLFLESAGGTWVVRNISGTSKPSLHSYGISLDLNPRRNPYGSPLRHNYPQAFINDVLALRTNNGKQVFTWGGTWSTPDAMHWQICCTPADLATGIRGYVTSPPEGDEDMETLTKLIQQAVKDAGFDPGPVDGIPGPQTQAGLTAALKATGPKGDTGPAGPAGPRGPAGPKGDTGPAGLRGPAGPAGEAATLTIRGDATVG